MRLDLKKASAYHLQDEEGYWDQMENYFEIYMDADVSHGLCRDCAGELYGDKEWYKKGIEQGRF